MDGYLFFHLLMVYPTATTPKCSYPGGCEDNATHGIAQPDESVVDGPTEYFMLPLCETHLWEAQRNLAANKGE